MELVLLDRCVQTRQHSQVTAVVLYFSYAKGDKKDEPRSRDPGRVCADCIEAAGEQIAWLTMDLDSPQIQGIFQIPVDHLYATPVLVDYFPSQEHPRPGDRFSRRGLRQASGDRFATLMHDARWSTATKPTAPTTSTRNCSTSSVMCPVKMY